MPCDSKNAFLTQIEKQHGKSLRRFLASRLRNAATDLPDLVQEVFLRLLRIDGYETIRNPEAYLITIAGHVLHQHTLRQSTVPQATDVFDGLEKLEAGNPDDPVAQLEMQQRIGALERILSQLSQKARATLILHRRDGYSIEEIGQHLGISRAMAKKYLAQALAHCREQLTQDQD